jgi:hypothetical protein
VSRRAVLITGFVAFAVIIVLIMEEIARQQRAIEETKHERAQKHFQELKNGDEKNPMIDSPELMSLVANDPACARKLTYVHFDMTDLNAPEFQQVQKLQNVTEISFYDCEGVETLFGYVANMPSVNKVDFFYARPTESLLNRLASIPNLKTIKFEDIENRYLDAFKRALQHVHFEVGDD